MGPFHNVSFYPISASDSNFNPRNIRYIPVVKIFAFLELEQNLTFCKGLKIPGKLENLCISSVIENLLLEIQNIDFRVVTFG